MGIFNRLFAKKSSKNEESVSPDQVIGRMLDDAAKCLEEGMPDRAFDTYQQILKLAPNPAAQYNLGSLYAQGKGTEQDFLQAAYWFHQAAVNGEANAERLRTKSLMDYIHQGFSEKTPETLYGEMLKYEELLYPGQDRKADASLQLRLLGEYHFGRQEYEQAAGLYRAAAELGGDGEAQNRLGILYNQGAGVEKDDLTALYWFDRAADQGLGGAAADRDGILNAYRESLGAEKFADHMVILAERCAGGTDGIPKDAEKADRWLTFSGKKEEREQKRARAMADSVRKSKGIILEHLEEEKCEVNFRVPGTNNVARLMYEKGNESKGRDYRFTVGVQRLGTDMLFSHYHCHGPREKVVEYLKNEESVKAVVESVGQLSESVDERW